MAIWLMQLFYKELRYPEVTNMDWLPLRFHSPEDPVTDVTAQSLIQLQKEHGTDHSVHVQMHSLSASINLLSRYVTESAWGTTLLPFPFCWRECNGWGSMRIQEDLLSSMGIGTWTDQQYVLERMNAILDFIGHRRQLTYVMMVQMPVSQFNTRGIG